MSVAASQEGEADADLTPIPEEATSEEEIESPLAACYEGEECEGEEACCFGCFCGPPGKFWIRGDYLLWWTKGTRLPALVTTSTDPDDGGVIGRPTTSVLSGNEWVNAADRNNARVSGGVWFDCGHTGAIDFDWYSLGRSAYRYSATSDGDPLLARPFYDVLLEEQAAELVAYPDEVRGTVSVRGDEYFHSGGVGLRFNLCCHQSCCESGCGESGCGDCGEEVSCGGACGTMGSQACASGVGFDCWRIDLVGGYRGYRLDEGVRVHESLVVTGQMPGPDPPAIGTTFVVTDEFRTRNEYHGGEIGLLGQFYRGRWSVGTGVKVALGNNNRIVDITGDTLITHPSPDVEPAHYTAGLLALDTNTGHYTEREFVAIPEIHFELGYQLTCRMRVYVGYDFLYWARVAHAADQIDLNVNTTYIPPADEPAGEEVPAFTFAKGDFWAHGLNCGLELTY